MSKDAEAAAVELTASGYVEVQEFNGLSVGSRVRGAGEQYTNAVRNGTGNVERIFVKENSHWAQKVGRADVELIVKRDKPGGIGGGNYMFVADYHVVAVEALAE